MPTSNQTQALRHHSFGDPFETLQLETLELPPLPSDSVRLRLLAAPVNPADFGRIAGSYGALADLPATAGLEGIAEVMETGSAAKHFKPGDRVLVSGDPGSWQTYAQCHEEKLFPAPPFMDDLQAAMFWVNPATAWRLMRDFASLKPGDFIVQNAATSAVGKLVIQFAHHLGVRTVNLVRNLDATPALKALGATHVVLDDREAPSLIRKLEGFDSSRAKLGLNAVGGSSALGIAKTLANSAPLVTYGGMDRDPAPFPTRYLIFNDLRLSGFWVSQWYKAADRTTIERMHENIAQVMTTASIATEIAATYPLAQWKEALSHSQTPGKSGKILFDLR